MSKENGLGTGKKIVIGAAVAALSAATYYFFGPEGKKHQKNFKSWMIKMKADIVEKIESAEEVTEALYHKIVEDVAAVYAKAGKASTGEISAYADVLKKQWKNISKGTRTPVKKVVKKTAKKVAKVATKIAQKK